MANFVNIQNSAYVPTVEADVSRVRTGFEEVIAHRCHEPCFAYSALRDGIIQDIDEATKTLIVRYGDGEKVCLNYGSEATNNSANGFYVNQEVTINGFKKGDKFKSGDILTYNRQFFQADPYSKQVRWKIGALSKVAVIDNGGTIEDASILTQPLCDKLVYNPVFVKQVVVTKDTNIHAFADVGTNILSTDPVMVFDESAGGLMNLGVSENDAELTAMLSDLNRSAPKAGHTGTVVKIEALYKAPISEMSPSLQKIVRRVCELKNAKSARAAECSNAEEFQKATPLVTTDKVGLVDMTYDTVILKFYIRQTKGLIPGDKIFFDSSLKSVCSTVYPESIMTEDGQKIDACTSGRGILARIITSPFVSGLANSVLEKLEQDILDVWDGKEPVNQNK